ncbi:hypothetical protein [Novosphingobium sp.]|uniref:hypothetical protein n=1 Tax=Novosphingobium sp. TaxID=1874826 RepID=UPI002617D8A0|nr:hypothetical protein [Novosphingobium sp.]
MSAAALVLPASWALTALALGLVRLGWSMRRGIALTGWAIGASAIIMLGAHSGAWGIATGFVVGIVAALALVLHAGARSAPRAPRREPRKSALPAGHKEIALARRLAVFVLVVPCAFCAALWLAYASQALLRRGGPPGADSVALNLFLAPTIWALLMVWQMLEPGPVRMLRPLAFAAVAGLALWSLA